MIESESVPLGDKVAKDAARQAHVISPEQQARLFDAHRSATRVADPRDVALAAITDFFRIATLNGYPINVQGSRLTVSTAAMTQPVLAPVVLPQITIPSPFVGIGSSLSPVPTPVVTKAVPTQSSVAERPVAHPLGSSMDHGYKGSTQTGDRIEQSKTANHSNAKPQGQTQSEPALVTPAAQPVISNSGVGAPTNPEVKASKDSTPRFSTSLARAYHHVTSKPSKVHQVTKKPHTNKLGSRNDIPNLGTSLIPIRLKRADGNRTIIAYVDVPTGYVVNGATGGERTLALPATDKFYDAGSNAGSVTPFTFLPVVDGSEIKVKVNQYSYLFNASMLGTVYTITNFSNLFSPTVGDYAYLEISQDNTTVVTDVELKLDSGWTGLPKFYNINSSGTPFVDIFYLPIAKFVDPSSSAVGEVIYIGDVASPTQIKIVQGCTSNLLLTQRALDGLVFWCTENYGAVV